MMTSDSENNPNVVNVNLASKKLETTIEQPNESLKLSKKARELLGVNSRREREKYFSLHPELAECCREVIISGINSDERKNLEGRYPNMGNCPLKAPELNPEVLPLKKKFGTTLPKQGQLSSQGTEVESEDVAVIK